MKKLTLSLLASLMINTQFSITTTNLGPLQLVTANGLNIFDAGVINLYGEINIGQSSSDTIIFQSSKITYPSSGNNSLLMIDSNGNVITDNTTNSSFTCGTLIAANASGESITLGNNSGSITIISSSISNPLTGMSPLYIDSNGIITTASSSKIYKEDIKILEINNDFFDLLRPVSFYYSNDIQRHLEYGFIAEDLIKIPIFRDTVIFDKNHNPLSINYQGMFIIFATDYLKTKKEIKNLKIEIESKNKILNELTNKIKTLETILTKIIDKINLLESY